MADRNLSVTFQSDAAASFSLFHDVAVELLKMMGHSGTVPGAILAKDVPAALARLNQALASSAAGEADRRRQLQDQEKETGQASVTLMQRAYPLIQMLSAAAAKQRDVLWNAGSSVF
jgi:hypothetical protein